MSNRQEYSVDALDLLKIEINKLMEARKKVLQLDNLLLQYREDIIKLIKSGCNAKEITKMFQDAHIKVGVHKVKKLYFAKKPTKHKTNARKEQVMTPLNISDEAS